MILSAPGSHEYQFFGKSFRVSIFISACHLVQFTDVRLLIQETENRLFEEVGHTSLAYAIV
jgi:hypothetical protein